MTSSDASEVEATSSREMFGRDIGLIAMIVVKLVISSLQAIHPSIHSRISGFPYNLFYMQESSTGLSILTIFLVYTTTDTNIFQLCP
jgi:hypothetical protein